TAKSNTPKPNGEKITGRSAGTETRPAITSSRVPPRKSRLPVSCSTRCGEVLAFKQCSMSSTTLVAASRTCGAKSRSATCNPPGLSPNHHPSQTCGSAATVANTTKSLDRTNPSAPSCTLTRPVVPDRSKYLRTPAALSADRSCTPISSNDQPVPAKKL